jgi:DNA repair exonuclease SbcCD ATPase subunit
VAKVDWNGLSTAISQINQLIQPSFAAKQKIEMDQFKDRVTFEYGLKELAEKQQELESLEESYNNKFNELTQTDASLTRNLNSVNDSGNAVNVASIIGKKSLDEINDNIDRINEESQRFVDAIKEVKSIDDSYKMGQNLSIPLTANENRPQEYLRGLPKTIDGVTTYTPFDSDNSGFLSPDERNVAITQMLLKLEFLKQNQIVI